MLSKLEYLHYEKSVASAAEIGVVVTVNQNVRYSSQNDMNILF